MLIRFIFWAFVDMPKRILIAAKNLLLIVNNEFSFTLNVRLLFTPLFGDYTIIGRLIGLVMRLCFIFSGIGFVLIILIVTIVLPIAWLLLPILIITFTKGYSLLILPGLFALWYSLARSIPLKRVGEVLDGEELQAFRPATKRFVGAAKKGSIRNLKVFFRNPDIAAVFTRAELDIDKFIEKINDLPFIDFSNIAKLAHDIAKTQNTRYVENEHLLIAILKTIPNIDSKLAAFSTNIATLENTIAWLATAREDSAKVYFWQEDYPITTMAGYGHGMTGVVTPKLDSISTDYTRLAQKRYFKRLVGREELVKKIANYLGGSNVNVLLIGEPGSGKTTIVKGLANAIIQGTNYKTLRNKRIVSLELGSILSGAKNTGDVAANLTAAMHDVKRSRDIILFIDEIHTLASGINNEENSISSIYAILEPHLASSEIQFIGATSIPNYRRYIEPNSSFARLFETIEIPEATETETLEILMHEANKLQRQYNIFITLPALQNIVRLSRRLIHERVFPDKALDILIRACNTAANSDKVVNSQTIAKEISALTHVPVENVTEDESKKLLGIEDELKRKVIGQDNAIKHVAAAIKRARAGIRDENKPIASFLFVGSTGVGKTETAKALSEIYFGDKKAMVRLDMSEYQTVESIEKLLGSNDGRSKGYLTEAVRTRPFTVLLLDEIEKAHPQILLLFLQVLDDGRLTDSSGKTIDFTNTIVIATSNAGTRVIQEVAGRNGKFEEMENAAMAVVREKFAPEFLNRFSAIIVFNPLTIENTKKIALLLLEKVRNVAKSKNIEASFSGQLIDEIVKRGYNPEWGARPMSRVVEDNVETYLAENLLSGEIKPGDTIELGTEVFENK
ncbi:ATP-dependent Clp protease ATP-binding subunit [Patescibacteria group bacterium]|nr:ATP-dependent Clp protease ATP-binding subunit [Patescibacteria group bacterium]